MSFAVHRDAGNRAFRSGDAHEAKTEYSAALAAASSSVDESDASERASVLANRAACCLRLREWAAVINDCTAALSLSDSKPETRIKALYRRATAFIEVGEVASAKRDILQLPQNDPKVKALLHHASERQEGTLAAQPATAIAAASTAIAARRRRVTCISPTTPERHLFHETALYRCFREQTYEDVELIVVDTGAVPSPFFTSPTFTDARVKYLYQRQHQTIGEKRNLAIQHASGDIICHFDDDDLYASTYIETMVTAMEAEGADFIKLSSWLVHDLQTDDTGRFDADAPMPHPQLEQLRENFLFTYGFSFLYRRALFPTFSFMATSWGEDQDILRRVREAGKTLALYRDLDGLCLHNQHGENCSRSFAQFRISRASLEASPLANLLDALPIIGKALARRGHQAASGEYSNQNGDGVVITSEVIGGLFVWSDQLAGHDGNVDETLQAFSHWLWSGNGFSTDRYKKLGLQRPRPPREVIDEAAQRQRQQLLGGQPHQQQMLVDATAHGLESLRAFESMDAPHAAGAITNPDGYRDPAKKSAPPTAQFAVATTGGLMDARRFYP